MFAYDYPVLGFFWSMLIVFLWLAWLMLLFRVVADIFRSRDIGGLTKALWLLLVVVIPFLGVFIYIAARGRSMTENEVARREAKFRERVQRARAGG
jgi:Phospholipase_D-nuclease N-terminal